MGQLMTKDLEAVRSVCREPGPASVSAATRPSRSPGDPNSGLFEMLIIGSDFDGAGGSIILMSRLRRQYGTKIDH